MPIEQSEVEKIIQLYLQKLVPNLSDHEGQATLLSMKLEEVIKPVIDKLQERASWAEKERDDLVDELESEQHTSADLREQLEEIEIARERARLIKIFEECC